MTETEEKLFDKLHKQRMECADMLEQPCMSGVKNSVVEKYSDCAHFVYELLQNADDAGATEAIFELYTDKVVFRHNGTRHFFTTDPDNEEQDKKDGKLGDVNAITSIANSAKNEMSIGRFGVGFKAVFQFTQRPCIYDSGISFCIERFIVPTLLDHDFPNRKENETVFEIPFDRLTQNAEKSFNEIKDKLSSLVYPTLFLNSLITVSFQIGEINGSYQKEVVETSAYGDIHAEKLVLAKTVGDIKNFDLLWRFSKTNSDGLTSCVGFFLNEEERLIPKMIPAFCYFPTRENTNLSFIIHAPFQMTDSRESIKAGDEHNKKMIDELARLAADSLYCLRQIGERENRYLIDDTILNIVPMRKDLFTKPDSGNSISFLPFYTEMREALQNGLLPTRTGYTDKEHAYWADTLAIKELLSDTQLSQLIGSDDIHFVFCSYARNTVGHDSESGRQDYIDTLTGQKSINETSVSTKINADFIAEQGIQWLHSLYQWIGETTKRFALFKNKPIFLDAEHTPAAAYDDDGTKLLFLPSNIVQDCPTILEELLQDNNTCAFLRNTVEMTSPSVEDYIFAKAIPLLKTNAAEDVQKYCELFFTYFLECPNIDDYIQKIKPLAFLASTNANHTGCTFKKAEDLYYPDNELQSYFSQLPDTAFINLKRYSNICKTNESQFLYFLNLLGIHHRPMVFRHELTDSEVNARKNDLIWSPNEKKNSHFLEYRIDGCNEVLRSIENNFDHLAEEKSFILWRFLDQILNDCFNKCSIESLQDGKCQYSHYGQPKEKTAFLSYTVKNLREKKWLVKTDGTFACADEVTAADLSEHYFDQSCNAIKVLKLLNIQYGGRLGLKADDNLTDEQRYDIALAQQLKENGLGSSEAVRELIEMYTHRKKGVQSTPNSLTNSADDPLILSFPDKQLVDTVRDIMNRTGKHDKKDDSTNVKSSQDADSDEYIPRIIDYEAMIEREKEKKIKEITQIVRMQALQDIAVSAGKYTFLWFKTLLEMELINCNEANADEKEINLKFGAISQDEATQRTYILQYPYTGIPLYVEELSGITMDLLMKDGTIQPVSIDVSSVRSFSLWVQLRKADSMNGIDLHSIKEITVKAERPVFLLENLKSAFEKLTDHNGAPLSDDFDMKANLPDNIEFVFGPPGTGKTTYLAQQVLIPLMENQEKAKVLVLAPTNKAADVLTTKIMSGTDNDSYIKWLVRFGSTMDENIANSEVYNYRLRNVFTCSKCVIVTTVARFPYDSLQFGPWKKQLKDINWDYIVIDEASMISLAQIMYPLYQQKPKKFIIAGDPFQIEPVTTADLWAGENIYKMINLNSFINSTTEPKGYHVTKLTTQYRSIPEIGELYSTFTYDGVLKHHRTSEERRDLHIAGLELNSLTIVKYPVRRYESIYRPKRLNGTTPYHIYSAIFSMEFVGYISRQLAIGNPEQEFVIGIIAPYRAQADLIDHLLSYTRIPSCIHVQVGTIHGFQGDECDIVIVTLNPPPAITESDRLFLNKQTILNVAISRAKDYLCLLMPDDDTENVANLVKIKTLESNMKQSKFYAEYSAGDIEKILFGSECFIEDNSFVTGHQPVNVYGNPEKQYEIRSESTAVDIQVCRKPITQQDTVDQDADYETNAAEQIDQTT